MTTTCPHLLTAASFILLVTSVEVNDEDKGIDISELEYLETRLLNNYHLVEIDSTIAPTLIPHSTFSINASMRRQKGQ